MAVNREVTGILLSIVMGLGCSIMLLISSQIVSQHCKSKQIWVETVPAVGGEHHITLFVKLLWLLPISFFQKVRNGMEITEKFLL